MATELPYHTIITLIGDHTLPTSQLSAQNPDPKSFFAEHVGLTIDKQEEMAANAVRFFKETHGLDFSSFKNGVAKYDNATLYSFQSPLKLYAVFGSVGKIDQEIEMTKHYPVTIGGYGVKFEKQQILHGTYGGDKGIFVNPGDTLGYQFYSIAISSGKSLVIQFQTTFPVRREPYDGHTIANMEVFHSELGSGRVHGVFHFTPKENNTTVKMRAVISFPCQ